MTIREKLRKAWDLLDAQERRQAIFMLILNIIGAMTASLMIGSVFPFLSVMADPQIIQDNQYMSWAYDRFGFASSYEFLKTLGVITLTVIVFASAMQILKNYVIIRFVEMRVHTLSSRMLSYYLRQPYEYFLNQHTGQMSKIILSEAAQVVQQNFKPFAEFVSSLLTVIAIVGLLVWVNTTVAVTSFAILGGCYWLVYGVSKTNVLRLGSERVEANGVRYRLTNEVLGGIKDVKILGHERHYKTAFEHSSLIMARSAGLAQLLSTLPQFVVQAIAFGGFVLLSLALIEPTAFENGADIGELLPLLGVFAFSAQRLIPELQRVYAALSRLQYGTAALDLVHSQLMTVNQLPPLPETMPKNMGLSRDLALQDVCYSYPQAEAAGLQDISLTVQLGETIGIVGSTGAGKTTLADILLGLLRPQTGTIKSDDRAVTDDNLRAWQRTVGYVPQVIFLSDTSISENIALGMPKDQVDMDRVRECARVAQLHEFITSDLPQGYDTMVGERGVRLSGGQRQRIGIARALYHHADLIVFDEATSALDNLTERDIMAAFNAATRSKTVIMIAHRLSTVRSCDRIVVMDGGRVADIGSYDELSASSEIFQRLIAANDL